MQRLAAVFLLMTMTPAALADHHKEGKQYIELRYYTANSVEAAEELDSYLVDALVPALNRAGCESVGVFREEKTSSEPLRLVVIAHNKIDDFAGLNQKLAEDKTYQSTATSYMQRNKKQSPLIRIRTELLSSFDCWPALKDPTEEGETDKIYELRIYESSNEHFGNLKVEMFNAGEVPIFLDSGIMPVFMGQAVAGDVMPNLTYMTVYDNQAAKDKGWGNFRKHPDWKTLSSKPKYKGSVSKIHKINLVAVKGSQL